MEQSTMLDIWLNPGSWTHEQWLVFSILGFIVVAVIFVAYRLFKILRSVSGKRELPVLRPGKRAGSKR
ncbi:MAG: hypothetical protein Q8K17_01225 [Pseudohongiella sp.]|nr:hypothetical protein [Pseudohongiella sp.]